MIKKFLVVSIIVASLFTIGCSKEDDQKNIEGLPTNQEAIEKLPENYSLGEETILKRNEVIEIKTAENADFVTQSVVLDQENPIFASEDIGLKLMPDFIESPVTLEVKALEVTPPYEDMKSNAFDFSVDTEGQDLGVIEISIPYPKDLAGDELIGAGYFNEETDTWEGVNFSLDDEKKVVRIMTDHLSIYSSFSIKNEKTRYARIDEIFVSYNLPDDVSSRAGEVIVEAINNNLKPGQKAVDLGLDISNASLGFSGSFLTLAETVYSTPFTNGLSEILGGLGSGAALLQVAADYSRGETDALVGNALKNIGNYFVSKFGTSLMQTAYVAVFAIDYSLNELIKTTLADRKNIWVNAYKNYYRENHVRSAVDWFYIIRDLEKNAKSVEAFKSSFNRELDRYTNLFWNEPQTTIALYQDSAQKSGATGGGGLNEKLEKDIAKDYKVELLTGKLQAVFNRLELEHLMNQQRDYRKAYEQLKKEMNQVVRVNVKEEFSGERPVYAGYYIRFLPLEESIDPKLWTGRITEVGRVTATFTVLGHLQAGGPKTIALYPDREALEKEKPELSIDFQIEFPETDIIIETKDRLKVLEAIDDYEITQEKIENKSGGSDYYFSAHDEDKILRHLLSKNTITIPEDGQIKTTITDTYTFNESGESESVNAPNAYWDNNAKYTVNELSIDLNLTTNEVVPVIGQDDKALRIAGEGSYVYNVTTVIELSIDQKLPSLGGEMDTKGKIVTRSNYSETGTLAIYAQNLKLNENEDIVLTEKGMSNVKTEGVLLMFNDPVIQQSGERTTTVHSVDPAGEESTETFSNPANMNYTTEGRILYFKFPKK